MTSSTFVAHTNRCISSAERANICDFLFASRLRFLKLRFRGSANEKMRSPRGETPTHPSDLLKFNQPAQEVHLSFMCFSTRGKVLSASIWERDGERRPIDCPWEVSQLLLTFSLQEMTKTRAGLKTAGSGNS